MKTRVHVETRSSAAACTRSMILIIIIGNLKCKYGARAATFASTYELKSLSTYIIYIYVYIYILCTER